MKSALTLLWFALMLPSQTPEASEDEQPLEEGSPEVPEPTPDDADVTAPAEAEGELPPTSDAKVNFAYRVTLRPSERVADVQLKVEQASPGVSWIRFHVEPAQHIGFEGDGELSVEGPDYIRWRVPKDGGELRWTSRLDHLRDPTSYDARFGANWALFRGSDLVPPAATRFVNGSQSSGSLRLEMPKKWRFVSRHPKAEGAGFVLEDPNRFFIRPSGWMMIGRIRTETFEVEGMEVTLATTRRLGVDLMEVRSFLRFTLPTFEDVLGRLPPRLVVVGAGDPMWRGGLSGPESIYLHRDRPLVDDDGTSPLLHELTHVFMGAKAGDGGDWVVEGIAEYYAIEVLYRSGGMSTEERLETLRDLRRKGRRVDELEVDHAKSRVTARAVAVLDRLDQRLRDLTDDRANLDRVLRALIERDEPITTESFLEVAEGVSGLELDDFFRTYVTEGQAP